MRDITVKFAISDEDEERLKKITELYRQRGLDRTEDKIFEAIMFAGSQYYVSEKLRLHEFKLGLRENFTEE